MFGRSFPPKLVTFVAVIILLEQVALTDNVCLYQNKSVCLTGTARDNEFFWKDVVQLETDVVVYEKVIKGHAPIFYDSLLGYLGTTLDSLRFMSTSFDASQPKVLFARVDEMLSANATIPNVLDMRHAISNFQKMTTCVNQGRKPTVKWNPMRITFQGLITSVLSFISEFLFISVFLKKANGPFIKKRQVEELKILQRFFGSRQLEKPGEGDGEVETLDQSSEIFKVISGLMSSIFVVGFPSSILMGLSIDVLQNIFMNISRNPYDIQMVRLFVFWLGTSFVLRITHSALFSRWTVPMSFRVYDNTMYNLIFSLFISLHAFVMMWLCNTHNLNWYTSSLLIVGCGIDGFMIEYFCSPIGHFLGPQIKQLVNERKKEAPRVGPSVSEPEEEDWTRISPSFAVPGDVKRRIYRASLVLGLVVGFWLTMLQTILLLNLDVIHDWLGRHRNWLMFLRWEWKSECSSDCLVGQGKSCQCPLNWRKDHQGPKSTEALACYPCSSSYREYNNETNMCGACLPFFETINDNCVCDTRKNRELKRGECVCKEHHFLKNGNYCKPCKDKNRQPVDGKSCGGCNSGFLDVDGECLPNGDAMTKCDALFRKMEEDGNCSECKGANRSIFNNCRCIHDYIPEDEKNMTSACKLSSVSNGSVGSTTINRTRESPIIAPRPFTAHSDRRSSNDDTLSTLSIVAFSSPFVILFMALF